LKKAEEHERQLASEVKQHQRETKDVKATVKEIKAKLN
jgi:uncharacterized protein YlxW (UPF0749 family)